MKNVIFFAAIIFSVFSCKSQQDEIVDYQPRENKVAERGGERGGERRERPSIDEVFKMDVNGDGVLSKSEVSEVPPLADRFDTIDSNSDGFISRTEFENAPRPERRGGRRNQ